MKALTFLALCASLLAQSDYDLLLRGGHVIDPKNNISAVRDVAVRDGKVAAVAPRIDPARAAKVVDATGLYVTPGLVDIHVHVCAVTGERGSYCGENSVVPDTIAPRTGVTTVVDAGGAGWRNFADFKSRIIDRSRTRVLAMLNIVGHGMRGGRWEQNLDDMDPEATARVAMAHREHIVGIKSAHYSGPEWAPVERSVEAGKIAGLPVMVDFGSNSPKRPIEELLTRKLRPGDIYTHVYSGLRRELLPDGRPNPGLIEARKRGVILDVGHGNGSFMWNIAVPLMEAGIKPDSISTDLHLRSMMYAMKDMLNVMSKFLALGMSVDEVIRLSTWNPANIIQRPDLGHLSPGAPADIAVLRIETGRFGFADNRGNRMSGDRKFTCELTLREGEVIWDLNAISAVEFKR